MEPGTELDALISKHVMEYGPGKKNTPLWWKMALGIKNNPYSTDLASAWDVVEKMEEYTLELVKYSLDDKDAYHVVFLDEEGYRFTSHGFRSAPHAICLAALKAKARERKNGAETREPL